MPAETLFIGIGSPHGDDRLGWHVADALTERLQRAQGDLPGDKSLSENSEPLTPNPSPPRGEGSIRIGSKPAGLKSHAMPEARVAIRKAATPADVLDWLEGTSRLMICDACRCGGPAGFAYRWIWPDPAIELAHGSGSHDLGLAGVLELAARLERLPPAVVVWGVELDSVEPQDTFSNSVRAHLPGIVDTIWRDLGHA